MNKQYFHLGKRKMEHTNKLSVKKNSKDLSKKKKIKKRRKKLRNTLNKLRERNSNVNQSDTIANDVGREDDHVNYTREDESFDDESFENADLYHSKNNCSRYEQYEIRKRNALYTWDELLDRLYNHAIDTADVTFEIPPLHKTRNLRILTKEEEADFMKEGVVIKEGKWLKHEDKVLKRNFEDYVKKYDIPDELQLLGYNSNDVTKQVRKIRKETNFFVKLGRDLGHRQLFCIYHRARKVFHPANYLGNFTPQEDEQLIQLQRKYGNQWLKIGDIMSRYHEGLKYRFRELKEGYRLGKWTINEDLHLENSIMKTLDIESVGELERDFRKYPWVKIHKGVPTRNFKQCRCRWLHAVSWRVYDGEVEMWTKEDSLNLINLIAQSDATHDSEIDFMKYFERFSSKVPSAQALRTRWHKIKSTIPNFHLKELDEVVDKLLTKLS